MFRRSCGALVFAVVAMSASTNALAEQVIIKDPFAFEQPFDAYSMAIPDGWSFQGSVQWNNNPRCAMDRQKVHFVSTDPDTGERIEMIPGGVWGWGSLYDSMPSIMQQADCRPLRILDGMAFMQQYIDSIRPGAELLSLHPRPDLAEKAMASIDPSQLLPGQRPRVDVVQADIEYTGERGSVYEVLIGTVLFLEQPVQTAFGGQHWYVLAMVPGTASVSSLEGRPDVARLEQVMESVEMLPAYEQRLNRYYQDAYRMMVAAHQRKNAARQAYLNARRAASASRSATSTRSSSGKDVLDIGMETWRNTSGMNDAGHAKSVDGVLERTPWQNTYGETVYMPQQYQRVYQLPNSVYAGTNDPFFNPVEATGQFGEELQPRR